MPRMHSECRFRARRRSCRAEKISLSGNIFCVVTQTRILQKTKQSKTPCGIREATADWHESCFTVGETVGNKLHADIIDS